MSEKFEVESGNVAFRSIYAGVDELEVVEFGNTVTVNLSEVIENNLDNKVFDDLFIHNDIDSIMYDIENILSGNVSEKWMEKFVNSLE